MKLFEPIKIGRLDIKNRIVMPAMHTAFGSEDGQVTERMVGYYEERAKGGAGLIIVEFTTVEMSGRTTPLQLIISDDRFVPGLSRLADAVKRQGAKIAIQLQHGGIKTSAKITQIQPVGPSIFEAYPAAMGPAPRVLTIKEISTLVKKFGEAARRARDAGFDAIELHCTHSYLIDQFMSPRFNQRTDVYGGNIENRARFACEIVDCMKERAGGDYPIICRITGDDYVKGGITLEDAKVNAGLLVKSGADCIHVSVGISDDMVSTPPMSFSRGCFVHLAQGVKQAVSVPVIAVGKIDEPTYAEQVLVEQKADLIAMGRSLVADPYLPQKTKKGEFEDIIPCISCNQGCISRVLAGLPMTCLANPAVGKEKEFEITPAEISRRVLIIGAGPAGLEAAIVCKKRGHDVIVAEKEKQLGGQLNYACKPPKKQDMEKLLYFLSGQIDKLKIQTHLGKKVTKRFIQEVKPDIVILATGSTPIVPEIPGTQSENVALATEILKGKEILGEKVIVVGGGQVGLETADFLSEAGRKVTVVEMSSQVGVGIPPRIMAFLMKRISAQNIRILVNRQVKEITSRGVRAAYLGQTEEITGDSVVLAVGNKSDISLLKELEDRIPGLGGLYVIGDCLEPRTALEAIHEAAQISKGI